MNQLKKVVMIGGGTGSFTVLSALRQFSDLDLTAVVSMADDGGSTGILRDEMGVLPPGDIRQCLVALSESQDIMRQLFNYRYNEGRLTGHNFGNLLISTLEKITGDFESAVKTAGEILKIRGQVIPVTTKNTQLCVDLKNQTKTICGQNKVDEYEGLTYFKIKKIYLKPEATITNSAKKAIIEADTVIIGPGNFYSSLIPNLLVKGMKTALKESKAIKIYNCNLMAKYGHTDTFTVQTFLEHIEKYTYKNMVDIVLYNTQLPNPELLQKYKEQESGTPVELDLTNKKHPNTQFVGKDLISNEVYINPNKKDLIKRTLIRHDTQKLAQELYRLIKNN